MSDETGGQGWWLASDGKWYPPPAPVQPNPVLYPSAWPTAEIEGLAEKSPQHRRRWPWIAGAAFVLLIIGIAAAGKPPTTLRSERSRASATTTSPTVASPSTTSARATTTAAPAPPPPTTPPTTKPPATTQPPSTAPPPPPVLAGFGDGTYLVNSEIKPGMYISQGGEGCYWEREKDLTGSLDSIAANDNAEGQAIVQIAPADAAFKTDGCANWVPFAPKGAPVSTFGDGTWAVRTEVVPGTYRSAGSDGCYWERDKDWNDGVDSIAANDNASGQAVVQISPLDTAFKSKDCGTWTRIG
jgi:hypothetical protein